MISVYLVFIYWITFGDVAGEDVAQCGSTFDMTEFSLRVVSPGNFTSYPVNLDCDWLLRAPSVDEVILYKFEDVRVICDDGVSAYDGVDKSANAQTKDFCTTGNPISSALQTTSGRNLLVNLKTDNVPKESEKGFFTQVIAGRDLSQCPVTNTRINLTATSKDQVLTSPKFPGRYSSNYKCEWTITPEDPRGKVQLKFAFIDIDTDNNGRCFDSVTVYEGENKTKEICGSEIFFPGAETEVISSTNQIRVVFTSDDIQTEYGFKLLYRQLAVPPIQSKTSLPQTWHIPSRRKGLEPKCVDGLQINKVKPQQPPKKKRRIIEGILPNMYCPVEKPIPGNVTQTLIQELKAISSDAQILQILPTTQQQTVQSTFGPVAYGSPLSYQQKPSDEATDIINHPDAVFPDFLLPQLTCTYTTVLNKCESNKYMGLQITKETSCDVEKQTQQQSHNKVWHDVRKNRITSSVFKDVCSRRGDFEVLALRLLKTKNSMTAQMKFGIENESVAAKAYCDITGNSVYLSGFVVNPSLPHLGTSPDRKVFDPQADPQFGLLEIKCPSKDSYTECTYLIQDRSTGAYRLKSNHAYFFQITGQMTLTGLKWCDFFVKCSQDFHLERICFDQGKLQEMQCVLDKFYFDELLPQICRNKICLLNFNGKVSVVNITKCSDCYNNSRLYNVHACLSYDTHKFEIMYHFMKVNSLSK